MRTISRHPGPLVRSLCERPTVAPLRLAKSADADNDDDMALVIRPLPIHTPLADPDEGGGEARPPARLDLVAGVYYVEGRAGWPGAHDGGSGKEAEIDTRGDRLGYLTGLLKLSARSSRRG